MSLSASYVPTITRVSILENHHGTSSPEARSTCLATELVQTHPSWQSIKQMHTSEKSQSTRPELLPAPGTASPGRWGRQSSSGGVTVKYWMGNRNGTSQPCTECSMRSSKDSEDVAPVVYRAGANWSFIFLVWSYVYFFLVLMSIFQPYVSIC